MNLAPSTPADGYDAGGIIPAGFVLPRATMHPVVSFTSEQIVTFNRLVELLERWEVRDNAADQSP